MTAGSVPEADANHNAPPLKVVVGMPAVSTKGPRGVSRSDSLEAPGTAMPARVEAEAAFLTENAIWNSCDSWSSPWRFC